MRRMSVGSTTEDRVFERRDAIAKPLARTAGNVGADLWEARTWCLSCMGDCTPSHQTGVRLFCRFFALRPLSEIGPPASIFWKSTIDPVRPSQYFGLSHPGPFLAEFAT